MKKQIEAVDLHARKFMADETEKWGKVIHAAGIKAE